MTSRDHDLLLRFSFFTLFGDQVLSVESLIASQSSLHERIRFVFKNLYRLILMFSQRLHGHLKCPIALFLRRN